MAGALSGSRGPGSAAYGMSDARQGRRTRIGLWADARRQPATYPGPMSQSPHLRVAEWLRTHPVVVDTAVTVPAWLLIGVFGTGRAPVEVLVATLQVLPLAARRWRPTTVFVVVCLAHLLQLAVLGTPLPSNVAFLGALYSVAAHTERVDVSRAALAVGLLGAVLGPARWTGPVWRPALSVLISTALSAAVLMVFVTAAWVAGDLVRQRRIVMAQLAQQNAALLRERRQREELAVRTERARIAREMHDVVAHSLSVVVVQADGAAYSVRHGHQPEPERLAVAASTLDTIGHTAREALAETRRLVGVLREGVSAEYEPTAGLADLPDLVDSIRASGLAVDFEAPATLPALSAGAELAAYRVAQEALTNVLRHAGPQARARLAVETAGGWLSVLVSDDGRGAAAALVADPTNQGHGLLGMRERVSAAGGRLDVGPQPGGGFRVQAWLPLDPESG